MPNKIKILGIIFVWFEGSYRKENANLEYIADYCRLDCMLNDEIEILEDNTEEIEEIEELKRYEEGNMYTYKYTEIPEKINELVKTVNSIRKELKNESND